MVRNLNGGNKAKKQSRKKIIADEIKKPILRFKENILEFYACVNKIYGNNYFGAICHDGIERKCIISGKFRHKNKFSNFVAINKLVLIGLDTFYDIAIITNDIIKNETKGRLLEVYTDDEFYQLKNTDHSINWKIFIDSQSNINSSKKNKHDDDFDFDFIDENTVTSSSATIDEKSQLKYLGINPDSDPDNKLSHIKNNTVSSTNATNDDIDDNAIVSFDDI